jgi:predicted flap endonuclease-1-like 5' DNA nuclease
MSYTLMKFLGWALLFALIGGVVGWCLHALRTRLMTAPASVSADQEEIERMQHRLMELGGVVEERNRLRARLSNSEHSDPTVGAMPRGVRRDERVDPAEHRRPEVDDLTLVTGIGPEIAELCRGIGIVTWQDLADAEQDVLVSVLDAADADYQFYDLRTWAQQADLLARGKWGEFDELVDLLDRRR